MVLQDQDHLNHSMVVEEEAQVLLAQQLPVVMAQQIQSQVHLSHELVAEAAVDILCVADLVAQEEAVQEQEMLMQLLEQLTLEEAEVQLVDQAQAHQELVELVVAEL